jgi:cytochrome c-type biogenesis protein
MAEITIILAFIAGLASFLSPCVLPLVPAFIGYLSGISLNEVKNTKSKLSIFMNTFFFVLGFSVIFALIGVLLNGILGSASYAVRSWLGRIGGIIIIIFGLYLLGLIKLKFLERDYQVKVRKFRYSYITSFLFGAAFAVGWTPCVGAILGGVLALAATQPGIAFNLLFAYSLGLGIPFLLTGLFVSQATGFLNKISGKMKYFNVIAGVILIILGILVFTDKLNLIANLDFVNRMLLK